VLAQQQTQGVQPIQETHGPQQPHPVALSREQQQLFYYQQQLAENQRAYNELKQKYDQQIHMLGSMESYFQFHGQNLPQDQFQQLIGQRMLCQQLWNNLEAVLKQQQELWHQFIMLGGVSEQQQLTKYEQQLVGIEGQLRQQLEQELHRLRYLELSSGGPHFGPDQQQQLLGQRAFYQQLEGDLQTVLKRQQEFRHKFVLRGGSAPQMSFQGQRTMLQGRHWVPVQEGPEQQRQDQRGMQVLQDGQWVPVGPDHQQQQGQPPQPQQVLREAENTQRSRGGQQQADEQRRLQVEQQRLQQQKEHELLQQKHSVDTQEKEKHGEVKEEHKEKNEERMEIEDKGIQLKQQAMSQQQQQKELLHKQQQMITKQQKMIQDPGGPDQQPTDKQQGHHEGMEQLRNLQEKLKLMMQQQQQGEEGGQQPNHDQQKQIEQEIQMLRQQIRSLELQMLLQQAEDGQRPSQDKQNQHRNQLQQSGVQTPAEDGSQQPGNNQQEQEKRMLEQQQQTQFGPQQPTDGQTDSEYDNLKHMWERVSKEQDKLQQEQILRRHRQQLEQRQRREGQLKEDERREPSLVEGQDDHSGETDVCECGTPFRPHARICANSKCGKARRKNQPQGSPCVHCGVPLIKEGAIKCGACNKKQSEAPAQEPGGTGIPPPPGLGQGYNYPNPPQQQPGGVQPTLSHTSQSAKVFGEIRPTQIQSGENKNLPAAGDKPPAMVPQNAQGSSTHAPQGSPATGVSGALPSNEGNDGGKNQPVVGQPPGVPDSARSTKDHSASGQDSHPISTEDAAAQSQAAAATKQKQTNGKTNNEANVKGANDTTGPVAGGENEDVSTATPTNEPQSTTQTGGGTINHPLAADDHGSGGDPTKVTDEKSREGGAQAKSYAAATTTNKKVLLVLNNAFYYIHAA
jgi:hypothetical protein